MNTNDTVVAIYAEHEAAEAAVKKLVAAGFPMKDLSVIGKGYHTEETVVGFYNLSDRVKFWGARGAIWGGLWGLFFGGVFLTVPVVGPVIVLGYVASLLVAAVESAVVAAGIGALAGALYSAGIPKDSVIEYEAAIKADGFLVIVRGTASEMARAKGVLGTTGLSHLGTHVGTDVVAPLAHVSA